MNSANSATILLVATVLLAVAAVMAGERFHPSEPFEPLAPCMLLLLGAGLFGFDIFVPATSLENCEDHGEAGDGDSGSGSGGSGKGRNPGLLSFSTFLRSLRFLAHLRMPLGVKPRLCCTS